MAKKRKTNQKRQNQLQAKKSSKEKIAPPVKSLKSQEVAYRRELNKLGKALIGAVREELLPYLKANQETYVADDLFTKDAFNFNSSFYFEDSAKNWEDYINVTDVESEERKLRTKLLLDSRTKLNLVHDGIGAQLNVLFNKLNKQFTGTLVAGFANSTAEQMVTTVATTNSKNFSRSIEKVTGVSLAGIIPAEGLEDFTELSVNKNVSLIKSLPEEYLKQVETIVNNGVVSGARYNTIAKEIMSKTGASSKLAKRIKTIATNEIQTINSQITLRRSESLGITEGIFRTSDDEKVRKCHKELNGVRYELSKGAWSKTCQKFIQPGITDINCR